jgi:hypothetical protein
LESNENDTRENDRMKSLFSLLQSYLLIYKWIQSLPRGVSLGRKVSGEGVDHMLYIFCNRCVGGHLLERIHALHQLAVVAAASVRTAVCTEIKYCLDRSRIEVITHNNPQRTTRPPEN